MKITPLFLGMVALCLFSADMVRADSSPPPTQTKFYFQQNGQPVKQPLTFGVVCYGTSVMQGDLEGVAENQKILKISQFSNTCSTYGCAFDTTNIFEVAKKDISYCSLEGYYHEQKFSIPTFLGEKARGLSCHRADYDIIINDKFYKETPEYNLCQKDENVQDTDQCKKYLVDVTNKLTKNKNRYPFDQICDTQVTIPTPAINTTSQQIPGEPTTTTTTTPAATPQKNIFSRIANFFRCTWLSLLGKSC